MPRKALESSRSLPTSPYAKSELDAEELNATRPFWYDADEDEATQDLRNVLTCKTPTKKLPEWMPAFEVRSLSAASTCATFEARSPMPAFEAQSPPSFGQSPSPSSGLAFFDDELESPTHAQTTEKPQCPPGALDKSSWLQARKVFVGGIPQTIDQNGLYQMFSKIGKVKKAWLQLFNNDRALTQTPSTRKHRGFGFVIFYERQAIDEMLGNEPSKFVLFGKDLKLEVKRAFGKSTEPDHAPSPGKSKQTQMNSVAASPARPLCRSPQTPGMVLHEPQACHIGSHMASPQWQVMPSLPQLVVAAPCVPPFPFVGTQPVPALVERPVSQPQQSPYTLLPGVLLHGLVGQRQTTLEQRAVDNQALMQALLQAMPDHYED